MKFGVIRFPGSNCDQDAYYTVKDVLGQPVEYLWHADANLKAWTASSCRAAFPTATTCAAGRLPGSRPRWRRRRSLPSKGGLVLGICNGFQVLCESHLLPGALVRNDGQKFVCKQVHLRTENADTPFTNALAPGQMLQVPVAHGEGKYVCDDATLDELNAANRVIFRYCEPGRQPFGQRQSERLTGQHRRHRQCRVQCPGPDAPPGTRRRPGPGFCATGAQIFESLLRFWR